MTVTEPLGTETAVAFERAIDRLRAGGVDVVEVPAPDFDGVEDRLGYPIALYEARRELERYLARHLPGLTLAELADRIAGPDVRGLFMDAIVDDAPIGPPFVVTTVNLPEWWPASSCPSSRRRRPLPSASRRLAGPCSNGWQINGAAPSSLPKIR